jgi:hypothetical protein
VVSIDLFLVTSRKTLCCSRDQTSWFPSVFCDKGDICHNSVTSYAVIPPARLYRLRYTGYIEPDWLRRGPNPLLTEAINTVLEMGTNHHSDQMALVGQLTPWAFDHDLRELQLKGLERNARLGNVLRHTIQQHCNGRKQCNKLLALLKEDIALRPP